MINGVLCFLGFHQWRMSFETLRSVDGLFLDLFWKSCRRCLKTEIHLISSERERNEDYPWA